MVLTIGNWVLTVLALIIGLCVTGALYTNAKTFGHKPIGAVINLVVTIIITVGIVFAFNWYNTSTASGIRSYKDFESEMTNGIERTIIITAEDGREIFKYEGKVDLDMDNEGNYLRFETQDGKRYTIEYGVQDSVIVVEK